MKKILIAAILLITVNASLCAQKEYKLAKSGGKLILNNIPAMQIDGYDGKEIVLTVTANNNNDPLFSTDDTGKDDPRARGLTALNNNGFDNTGLGLNITEKGTDAYVSSVSSLINDAEVQIKVPNNVALSINNSGWPAFVSGNKTITLNNIKSEITISAQFENFKLNNLIGPLSIKTFSGNIEIQLNKEFKEPISAYTTSGFIDMTVPEDAKADLTVSTLQGVIYADKSLNLASGANVKNEPATVLRSEPLGITADTITINGVGSAFSSPATVIRGQVDSLRRSSERLRKSAVSMSLAYSGASSTFNGTLNGGGPKIKLQSFSGKIYLRR